MAAGPSVRRSESGTPETRYETQLTPGAEQAYGAWKARVAPNDPGNDYDYRGAFAAGADRDASGHMTDEFKKPNHPTFSNESNYASYAPQLAGSWDDDRYVPGQAPNRPPEWLVREQGDDASDPRAKSSVSDEGEGFGESVYQTEARKPTELSAEQAARADALARGREPREVDDEKTGRAGRLRGKATPEQIERQRQVDALVSSYKPIAVPPGLRPAPNRVDMRRQPVNRGDYATAPADDYGKTAEASLVARGLLPPDPDQPRYIELAPGEGELAAATSPSQLRTPISFQRDPPQTSDPRGKVLGGVHDDEVADMLDETPAVSYRYKSSYFEPEAQRPGERQVGFLTSDLKRTPMGAAVVEQRPDGFEGYNEHRMIGLEFAGLRNLHERLRDLETVLAEKHRGGQHG